jgi:hypothetical protein
VAAPILDGTDERLKASAQKASTQEDRDAAVDRIRRHNVDATVTVHIGRDRVVGLGPQWIRCGIFERRPTLVLDHDEPEGAAVGNRQIEVPVTVEVPAGDVPRTFDTMRR